MKTIVRLLDPQLQEPHVIAAMIQQYCRRLHRGAVTCDECKALEEYVTLKISHCRSGRHKTACLYCDSPCMSDAKRLQLKHVITWSLDRIGWREPSIMLKYHWMSACHRHQQLDALQDS
ncbi:nitrous oxide-stimulated promoter family protein [Thaumasiovibrio subtropicus]|uniref:nitrous oxide-stimulated promoter family protein n=1 Tax=Thaumasiovibrio subtropicus TaxID=1891207 RepID=UPI000B35E255|nr:nitrous oxide-stimulated promoter family protein [Thaumasiovibrio subtropicus]